MEERNASKGFVVVFCLKFVGGGILLGGGGNSLILLARSHCGDLSTKYDGDLEGYGCTDSRPSCTISRV